MRLVEWKHHHSLLVSVVVTAVLVATRPDFEWEYMLPFIPLGGGGYWLIIKIERRRSLEMEALKTRLRMEEMQARHDKKMLDMKLGTGRAIGFGVLFAFVGIMTLLWLGTYGPEGIQEWLGLFGCRC